MPKVSYNGNGNTGGSVPVDNTSYAAGGLGSTWLMNGTPTRWLNTSLPASNPASTEFDANSQFGSFDGHALRLAEEIVLHSPPGP